MADTIETTGFLYNVVGYPGAADPVIHPRCVEMMAHMFGLSAAPVSKCRVLELGCADGTNLLPYAEEFPGSEFVGVDLTNDRILEASSRAEKLGLSNIRFRHANVTEVDENWGHFDYIQVPGVFSWATDSERQAILDCCRRNLKPGGAAVISWNVYPGWKQLGMVRDFIRRHVRVFHDALTQISEARRAVDFLARCTPEKSLTWNVFQDARDRFQKSTDHYIFHDFISEHNQPFYFYEFDEFLRDHGLQFVAEADMTQTAAPGLPLETQQTLRHSKVPEREQLLDFLVSTTYRRSIVTHRETTLNRRIDYRSIAGCSLALAEIPVPREFDVTSPDLLELKYSAGSLCTSEPLGKAALRILMNIWPRTIPLNELCTEARRMIPAELQGARGASSDRPDGDIILAQAMLAACAAGLVRAFRTAPTICTVVSEFPRAAGVARLLAVEHPRLIVNRWHQNLTHLTPEERFLLSRLDGTRSVADLCQMPAEVLQSQPVSADRPESPRSAEDMVREKLALFAREYRLLVE
ncbi:MAG: methyltransferase regulatory domain-containing protein [Planctomycetaceae bacterium]|nr:methyltransferase regulatory domain-containing protein [Planctomycetaceae bacterium]